MLLETSQNSGIAKVPIMFLVDRRKGIQLMAALGSQYAFRIIQIEHGFFASSKNDALMIGGYETASPKPPKQARSLLRTLRMHHDVTGQIRILTAQPIAQPGAQTRPPWDLAARLDIGDCRIVIDRLSVNAVNNAESNVSRRSVAKAEGTMSIYLCKEFLHRSLRSLGPRHR